MYRNFEGPLHSSNPATGRYIWETFPSDQDARKISQKEFILREPGINALLLNNKDASSVTFDPNLIAIRSIETRVNYIAMEGVVVGRWGDCHPVRVEFSAVEFQFICLGVIDIDRATKPPLG